MLITCVRVGSCGQPPSNNWLHSWICHCGRTCGQRKGPCVVSPGQCPGQHLQAPRAASPAPSKHPPPPTCAPPLRLIEAIRNRQQSICLSVCFPCLGEHGGGKTQKPKKPENPKLQKCRVCPPPLSDLSIAQAHTLQIIDVHMVSAKGRGYSVGYPVIPYYPKIKKMGESQ